MSRYTKTFTPNQTAQTQPMPGKAQVKNAAGGYVFAIDDWTRLDRFLILGSDAPTYYQSAQALTRENALAVIACWDKDPERTATAICEISHSGRAPRQAPALFALALGTINASPIARAEAYKAVPIVCRTASHLFEWIAACRDLGKGWGRGFRRAIADWYTARKTDNVAYQMVKYRSRNGFDHKRALEVSHKGAGEDVARAALYKWVRGKDVSFDALPEIVRGHIGAMANPGDSKLVNQLVASHKLPWEAIPTEMLRAPEIWTTMLPDMGLTALIRNLGNMTEVGAIKPGNEKVVVERLKDAEALKKARVHPFNVLQALHVYGGGKGFRGGKAWTPVPKVTGALDEAFYAAFKTVEPTGKRIYLGLDVSGSMSSPLMGSSMSCLEAEAAMALVTMAVEDSCVAYGFTAKSGHRDYTPEMTLLDIDPKRRLDDVIKHMRKVGEKMGRTDCSLPMQHALKEGLEIDAFLVYTDNETYAGSMHPVEALRTYRKKTGIAAKLVVIGMTSTGFSIADPSDGGMLDIVGFDSNGPALISDFIKA